MKLKTILTALFCCVVLGISAKDLKTIVLNTEPQMHCANCENRVKESLKFEKGVKDIVTNLDDKTVTVKYDADKTNPENIVKALAKADYKASEVGAKKECQAAESCCKKAEGAAYCAKAEGNACPKAAAEGCKKTEGSACCAKAEGNACPKAAAEGCKKTEGAPCCAKAEGNACPKAAAEGCKKAEGAACCAKAEGNACPKAAAEGCKKAEGAACCKDKK